MCIKAQMGGRNIWLSVGGELQELVDADTGKVWRFEEHPYFGPSVVGRDELPRANQPGPRSPFWRLYYAWKGKAGQ